MAKAGKVHHWKHGWIPLDATALAMSTKRKPDVAFDPDVPEQHRAELAAILGPLQRDFPRLGQIRVSMGASDDALATAANGRILLNSKLFDEDVNREAAASWKGIGLQGQAKTPGEHRKIVITHEVGHLIEKRLTFEGGDFAPTHAERAAFTDEKVTPRQVGYTVGDTLDKAQERWKIDPLSKPGGWNPQSVYANESRYEFFAEAFADGYLHGHAASASGKRALALAKKHLG